MAKKYVLHPIKTLKDWQGEDWNVYEERKSQIGIILNYGWLYSMPSKGSKALIIKPELAEAFKQYSWREMIDLFGIASSTATKIRRELNLNKKVNRRDYSWIVQHQNEILYYSFPMLLDKYGLSKSVVQNYSYYLVSEVGVKCKRTRNYTIQYVVEKIYQTHKASIAQCRSFKELQNILQTDDYTARKFHELACAELNVPAMSEIHLKKLDETWHWRYQHRDTILNPLMTIKQIAEQLKTTIEEIHNARKVLRRKLKIEETIGQAKREKRVLQHAIPLTNLKIKQLQQDYQISKGQIKYRRMLLKN